MAAVVLLLAVVGQLPQGFYKYPPSQMVLWVSGALLTGIFIGLQARSRSGENRRSESETPAAAESYNP